MRRPQNFSIRLVALTDLDASFIPGNPDIPNELRTRQGMKGAVGPFVVPLGRAGRRHARSCGRIASGQQRGSRAGRVLHRSCASKKSRQINAPSFLHKSSKSARSTISR
jgi:hypothetical protein